MYYIFNKNQPSEPGFWNFVNHFVGMYILHNWIFQNFKKIGRCPRQLCSIRVMHNYEVENKSAPGLEIEGFLDHNPDLFYNQQNISDRLVYDMYGFWVEKKFSQAEGVFQV